MKIEDVKLAIDYYEKQLNSAQVVLDSGFGEKENESNHIYLKRKEMSSFALVALKEKLDRLENKPLTLSELKEMVGEPVWWVNRHKWIIVKEISKFNKCENISYNVMLLDDYGYIDVEKETFYKHKPNGGSEE